MEKQDVKRIRLARGLEQQEFADILGVCRQTVSFWETGDRTVSPKSIKKIIQYCEQNNIKY